MNKYTLHMMKKKKQDEKSSERLVSKLLLEIKPKKRKNEMPWTSTWY